MSILFKTRDQRLADQSARAGDQDRQASRWLVALGAALRSGSWASLCSTLVISTLSRRRTGRTAAATNATSQWLWGDTAHRQDGWSARYTALGYVIHHASSLFWAFGFERLRARRRGVARTVALAATTTAIAYVVDYKVVPPRLSPGFDQRLHRSDLFLVYVGFAAGLALPYLIHRHR
jgi:hypothetical protein